MKNSFLYKYRSFGENTNKIIKNASLYLSPIEKFNDPFDSSLTYRQHYAKEEIRKYWKGFLKGKTPQLSLKEAMKLYGKNESFIKIQNKIRDDARRDMGVLSLSKNCTNILMWSHYADNHKGLVFEFEPKVQDSCLSKPMKMDYEVSYDVLSYVAKRGIREKQYIKELLTKFKDWEYEEEYRVIELNFNGEKNFQKDELKSIIFGLKATQENIDAMMQLCQENGFSHVKFKKAEAIHGKFELAIRDF